MPKHSVLLECYYGLIITDFTSVITHAVMGARSRMGRGEGGGERGGGDGQWKGGGGREGRGLGARSGLGAVVWYGL